MVRKMMSHMFKVGLNGESQRGGCDRWLQPCCIQTGGGPKEGETSEWSWKGREGKGGGGPGSF